MVGNAYQIGPKLIFRGFLLGSCVVCLIGFYLTSRVVLPTHAEETAPQTPQPSLPTTGEENMPSVISSSERTDSNEESCQVSEQFPKKVRRWCNYIEEAAQMYDLPPDLIAAIIWIESGGDPFAYSHSGAVGLMQVMPSDGLASQFMCVNGPCFSNRPTIEQLQDAQFNVRYGSKLLASLIKKYGNYRDALKAYGPMKVGYSYADKVLGIYRQYGQ